MTSLNLRAALLGATFAAAIGLPAAAATLTDFNFNNVPLGSTPPTTFPAVDSYPQHNVYAIGGFPDDGTVTGTVTVQNVGGMNHAAVMSTNQGGTGSLYVDTQFESSGTKDSTSFDLDIITTPTSNIPQATTNAPNGQAFVINSYGNLSGGGVGRAFRWVATPTSDTGGIFGLRNDTDGDIVPLGTYDNGTTYHVELDTDFLTHTLDAFIDGSQVATDFPFVDPVTNMAEYFIFQNGVEGVTNTVAFDNLITRENVPEPASLVLLATGLLGVGLTRRRRGRATT